MMKLIALTVMLLNIYDGVIESDKNLSNFKVKKTIERGKVMYIINLNSHWFRTGSDHSNKGRKITVHSTM